MELGEKLRQARLAAGLSQRQLCGETITRNMLSQIEHGTANPSMETLRFLAGRLGKPVSFFLEEEALTSANAALMEKARQAYARGDWSAAEGHLKQYRAPDPVFDGERGLLGILVDLALARQALAQGLLPYARELLIRAADYETPYKTASLERERLLLLFQARPRDAAALASALPVDDRELLLRARAALPVDPGRCAVLLDAAQEREAPAWALLRGQAHLALGEYEAAAACLLRAESTYPGQAVPLLEQAYRALEDYKMAYFYACKQFRKE